MKKYLRETYGTPCEFGGRSCEHIAEELAEKFDCDQVIVKEDGENGGIATRL